MFEYIDPNGALATQLEQDGYIKKAWDSTLADNMDIYLSNILPGITSEQSVYWGLGYPEGTDDEWTPYIVPHYGGLLLHTGRLDQWYVLQKDSYTRQYWNRDRVFAHPLNILPMVDEPKWVSTNI